MATPQPESGPTELTLLINQLKMRQDQDSKFWRVFLETLQRIENKQDGTRNKLDFLQDAINKVAKIPPESYTNLNPKPPISDEKIEENEENLTQKLHKK